MMKLLRDRHDVFAVMPEGSDAKIRAYMERLGVACEYFPAHMDTSVAANVWHKVRRRLRDARCSWVIARHMGRHDVKNAILHADLGSWSWFWLLLYFSLRSNVFVTFHIAIPDLPLRTRLRYKCTFAILHRLRGFHPLVSNLDMRKSLEPYLPGEYLSRIPLAYTGVDCAEIRQVLGESYDRREILGKYGLPGDRFLVFSLGQVIERKGCMVLLDAVERIRRIEPSLFFVWIGDGMQRREVETRANDCGLKNSFRIIPPRQIGQDRLDLLRLLRGADLFVHPSFAEGLPGAVLEAMALGKACVASSVNAIPEAITDRETGLLVPPGDSVALSDAILELVRGAAFRERLATAGQSHVMTHFNERFAAEATIATYRTCFNGI